MNRFVLLVVASSISLTSCSDLGSKAAPWSIGEEAEPTSAEPTTEASATAVPEPDVPSAVAPDPVDQPFVVHEWGTFTSLQGSDGRVQNGMHYEEESLPAFVYGRVPPVPGFPRSKQVEDTILEGVTQKLETPVIYFYGAPEKVDVTVDFPRGIVSQWYPNATSFAPEVYEAEYDVDNFLNGSMTWSLDVLPKGETAGLIDVPEEDVWAPSRNVDAQPVRFGDEVEKFIFYRGLGRFETPFRVTSEGDRLTLHNDSAETVPDVWILHWNGEAGTVRHLGELGPNATVDYMPGPKETPTADYLEDARKSLVDGLVRSGLTEDESWAMVDTWNRSYFKTPGLRILYTVPRKWTDELLPIEVTPQPDELVRTLVGRVEVMTQSEEQKLLGDLGSGTMNAGNIGRFAEPRLQRALELTDDPAARERILQLILEIRGQP